MCAVRGVGGILYKEVKERVPRMENNHVKVQHIGMTQSLLTRDIILADSHRTVKVFGVDSALHEFS